MAVNRRDVTALGGADTPTNAAELTAVQARHLIATGALSCEELARACLDRIALRDADVKAWLALDPDYVIRQARELDKSGGDGLLRGLPIAVKDIIDTRDYPTTHNSPLYAGVQVGRDAACVAVARGLGALIMGKTDTTEFAAGGRAALTRNPYHLGHTPGASSAGSAAAVADFQVPLAFGTQTGGSLLRPASFNGIYAYKPSWSLVSREGVRMSSLTLDTVGWYARGVEDLALVARGFDIPAEPAPVAVRGLRVAVCRGPKMPALDPAGESALATATERLTRAGAIVADYDLPPQFDGLLAAHAEIMLREGGVSFLPEYVTAADRLAPGVRSKVERSRAGTMETLRTAYRIADACRPAFDALFGEQFDVVLGPSSGGEAPEGLADHGNPIFNKVWTLLHVPVIGVPCTYGPNGLPVGVSLVGPRLGDAALFGLAAALAPIIDPDPDERRRRLLSGAAQPG